jgi:DNA transposition AAA+ family ATPase
MAEVFQLHNPAPDPDKYCETQTSRRIIKRIDLGRDVRAMVAIVGAPGVGKTRTLQHYEDTRRGARYCFMTSAFSSVSAALDRILTAVGYSQGMPGEAAATKHVRIVDAIKREYIQVLLIDEAQELTPAAINAIRAIHDETGVTIVLAGNPKVINQFYESKGGGLKPEFAQIGRRINVRADFKNPTPADVEAIARHWEVHDPKAHGFLKEQAAVGEGLGRMEGLIRKAREFAKNGPVTRQHLEQALKEMRMGI